MGGLLFAIARAVPFLADSVSYAFSATAKLLTRAQFQVERTQERGNLAAEFTSGLRWLWRQPLLRTCSLLTAAANPTWRALYLMLVVLAKRHGASSTLVGVMFAMIAAGGLLGGFLAGSRFADRISARAAVRFDICVTALLMPLLLIAQGTLFTALIVALIEVPAPIANSRSRACAERWPPSTCRVGSTPPPAHFPSPWAGPDRWRSAWPSNASRATMSILMLCGWALLSALGALLLPHMRSDRQMGDLAPGRTFLITGANTGIGRRRRGRWRVAVRGCILRAARRRRGAGRSRRSARRPATAISDCWRSTSAT